MESLGSTSRVMVLPVRVLTKIACLLSTSGLNGEWTPSECCNLTGSFHLPAAYQRRSTCLLSISAPSEGWTPFGCCNLRGFFHPQAVCRRRSTSADQGGYLPCPESWP